MAWLALNGRAPRVLVVQGRCGGRGGVAHRLLGLMYRRGYGVQMDPVEALKHAERAVELGEDPRVLELFDAPPLQARVKLGTGGDRCRGGAVCRCYFVA